MYPLKQSTALTVPFFAHDASGDGVTGLADGGFTKRISKNGGAFADMTVTVSEMENGWYSIPLSTAHSDTLGILTISLSHASCKRVNLQFRVHARIYDDLASPTNITSASGVTLAAVTHTGAVIPTVSAVTGLTAANLDVAVSSRMATYTQPTGFLAATFPATVASPTNITSATGVTVSALGANVITSASIAASALDNKGNWNVGKTGYSLTVSPPTAADNATAVWNELTATARTAGSYGQLHKDNINATIGSRSSHSAADVWSSGARTLTAGTNIVLAKGVGVTGFNDIAATDVWAAGTRTLSAFGFSVTVGTNNDKTGYSLSQSFPANFSSLAITGGGAVTAGTVSDKTGYSLAVAPPTAAAIRSEIDANSTKLDVAVSTRANGADYTALRAANLDYLDKPVSDVAVVATGAALNVRADSFTMTTGSVVSGTYLDTYDLNGVYHRIAPDAGDIAADYEFDVGADYAPVSMTVVGRMQGVANTAEIYAWHWGDGQYRQIGTLAGKNGAPDLTVSYPLFIAHVGTGINAGKVRLRFGDSGANNDLFIDQLWVSFTPLSAFNSSDRTMVDEMHRITGLRSGVPLEVTETSRTAGAITQTIGESAGTVTVTRT